MEHFYNREDYEVRYFYLLANAAVLASRQPSRKPVCKSVESESEGMILAEARAFSMTESLFRSLPSQRCWKDSQPRLMQCQF